MKNQNFARDLLVSHCSAYPGLQPRDLFKFIYQSAMGCEHLLSDPQTLTQRIEQEYSAGVPEGISTEPLAGDYSRVHLSCLHRGMAADTLGKLFFLSGKQEAAGQQTLEQLLELSLELAREKAIPFSPEVLEEACRQWAAEGHPPVRHSEEFRVAYRPAYRVISNQLVPFLPLFLSLDRLLSKGPAVIAIEGGSASGKSTLGQLLSSVYGCTVLHMDDFFLQPHQRTAERLRQPGGNVDRERFLEEVLLPLSQGKPISYRPYDCATGKILSPTCLAATQLTVIEGAYSMHPELAGFYDYSVFLDISPQLQTQRIRKRNTPAMAERFFTEWIPLEHTYFTQLDVKNRCDLTITIPE